MDGTYANDRRNVLVSNDNGLTWTIEEREPVYALDIDEDGDGVIDTYEGNPYMDISKRYVQEDDWHGTRVYLRRDMLVGAIDVYLGASEVLGDIYLLIYDHTNRDELVEKAELLIPVDLPTYYKNYAWTRFALPRPKLLKADREYYLLLASPDSYYKNNYRLLTLDSAEYWADLKYGPYDRELSAGGSRTAYCKTSNGKVQDVWVPIETQDTPTEIGFRLLPGFERRGVFITDAFDAGQVVDWLWVEWDESRPPRTWIRAWVIVDNRRTQPGPEDPRWQEVQRGAPIEGVGNSRYLWAKLELQTDDAYAAPALYELRVGYRMGLGKFELSLKTQHLEHSWIHEGGAVILSQGGRSLMRSAPELIEVENDQGLCAVELRMLLLTGEALGAGTAAARSIKFYLESEGEVESPVENAPNRAEVTVTVGEIQGYEGADLVIESEYPEAWGQYLRELHHEIEGTYPGWSQLIRYGGEVVGIRIIGPQTGTVEDVILRKSYQEISMSVVR
jgi:hypothetical protein